MTAKEMVVSKRNTNMDQGNPEEQKDPHSHCPHGHCIGHSPEWKDVGEMRTEPNPGIFGKTYCLIRHCGQSMAKYKKVQTRRCNVCGRTEDHVTCKHVALCLCCGYSFDTYAECGD